MSPTGAVTAAFSSGEKPPGRVRRLALALCLSLTALSASAGEVDLDLSGGSLWHMLEQLSGDTGRSIVFEVDADVLREETHAPLKGRFDLHTALDALLQNTRFRWRTDEHGQVVVFEASTMNVALSELTIEGTAESQYSEPPESRSLERPRGHVTLGQRLEGEQLAPLSRADFSLLGRRAPNVSGVGPQLAIRGVEQGLGLSSTATLTVDEMPLSAQYALQAQLPARLSAVDYLRGPRTSLDALGGLGGAIRVFSEEPAPPAQGEWRMRGSSRGGLGLGLHWAPGDALSGHSWALTATSGQRPRDVRRFNSTDDSSALQSQVGARGIYEPDRWPGLSVRWSALAFEGEPHRRPVLPPFGPDLPGFDPLAGISFDPFLHDENLSFGAAQIRVEYEIGRAKYWLSGAGFDSSLKDRSRPIQSASESLTRFDIERFSTSGVGAQWRWSDLWLGRVEVSQGRRRREDRELSRTLLSEFFPSGAVQISDPDATRVLERSASEHLTEDALLLELRGDASVWTWGLGARGVRYQRDDGRRFRALVEPSDCQLSSSSGPRPCLDYFPLTDSASQIPSHESHWSPAIDLGWNPNPQTSVSLWWRRGLRPGGARSDPGSGRLVPFRAERSESLDLNTSLLFPGPSIALNATLFAVRWKERQVRVDLPVAQSFLIANAGSARSHGAEVELRWAPNDRLEFWVELGLLHTEFDRFPLPVAGGTVDLAGNHLPGAPRYSGGLGAVWKHPSGWQWQANIWQVADSFSDATNTEVGRRPGYGVVDVHAERSIGESWTMSASITNLLDRRYLEHVRVAGIQPTAREYWPGERRMLQVELGYRW